MAETLLVLSLRNSNSRELASILRDAKTRLGPRLSHARAVFDQPLVDRVLNVIDGVPGEDEETGDV